MAFFLVRLAQLQQIEEIIPATAEAIGFKFYDGSPPSTQLVDYLREKEVLLLLDNFEHLLAAKQYVVDWLQSAPGLKVLVTSRTRLNLHGEQQFPLHGLDFEAKGQEAATDLASLEAIQLFFSQAKRIRPSFSLTAKNLPHLRHICQAVAGMPLGILLAASWLEVLNPIEIVAEMSTNLDFLASEQGGLPPRQRSLRVVFEHSWHLLTESQQVVFRQISVFQGTFSREAAQAVTGAKLKDLLGLSHKSLLRRNEANSYELHPMLRQYGAEKLALHPAEAQTVHKKHSHHYLDWLAQQELALQGSAQKTALDDIEHKLENIQVAWDWTVTHNEVALMYSAVDVLGYFYAWRSYFEVAAQRLGQTLANLSEEKHLPTLRLRLKILIWLAIFHNHLGQFPQAEPLVQESLALLNELILQGDDLRADRAFILREAGNILNHNRNKKQAKQLLQESLALYRTLASPWHIAQCLWMLSESGGDEDLALIEESRQIQLKIGDRRGFAHTSSFLGFPLMLRNRMEEGEHHLQQVISVYQELGDQNGIIRCLNWLGIGYNMAGRNLESIPLYEQAIELAEQLGIRMRLASIHATFGVAKLLLGDYQSAIEQARIGLNLAYENASPGYTEFSLWTMGVTLILENPVEACRLLQKSVDMHRQHGEQGRIYSVIASLGLAVFKIGNITQARECLKDILEIGFGFQDIILMTNSLSLATLLLLEEDKIEQAVEIYALAQTYPRVTNSQWYEDLVGQAVTTAAKTLSKEEVIVAQERGAKRDITQTAVDLQAMIEFG